VLLEGAAVIGGEVPLALWTRISGGDEDAVLALIDDAVAARLLTVLPDGAAVQFMHALTRDALYASISLTRRRALHRAVAEALMARATAEPEAVAAHLRAAGDARARDWLLRAAAPLWAAWAALTNQYSANHGQGSTTIGFPNLSLYQILNNSSQYPTVFHDIPASGDNCVQAAVCRPSGGSVSYPVQTGYDLATGIGSFNAGALAIALGPPPVAALSTSSLAFGSYTVGAADTKIVTVTNQGQAPLNFSHVSVTPTDAFSLSGDSCSPRPVAPNGTCGITVHFQPSAAQVYTATLSLYDNAASSPQTVALTGAGAYGGGPVPVLNPASTVDFGNTPIGASYNAFAAVTLSNGGSQPLTVNSYSLALAQYFCKPL